MGKTLKLKIKDRVFAIADLRRIAAIFEEQRRLANASHHTAYGTYSVHFSDDTIEDDDETPSTLLTEERLMSPSRPMLVYFRFRNVSYENRELTVRIAHGEAYLSEASVSGTDPKWVNDQFANLKGAIETAKPQELWILKHKTLFLQFLAVAIGTLFLSWVDPLLNWLLAEGVLHLVDRRDPLHMFLVAHETLFYCFVWVCRWGVGISPALLVRRWLFSLWPSVELDVGAEHLKTEKRKRKLVFLFLTLAVLPIAVQILYDHFVK
jgi:hypothetical protein